MHKCAIIIVKTQQIAIFYAKAIEYINSGVFKCILGNDSWKQIATHNIHHRIEAMN